MKVILSRKGFDESAGGFPSPHFVENGRLLTLPIPEDEKEISTGKTYADLVFNEDSSYQDIMNSLGLPDFKNTYAHLDPDINDNVIPYRESGWRGLFGQSSQAQSHLRNKGITAGDLFLFFGWFRDVRRTTDGYKYVSGTNRHIIWGYLQVGEVETIWPEKEYEQWKAAHPHYSYRKRKNNTGYIASERLSFLPHLPGHGLFNFDERYVLTCPGQTNRSVWKLPKYFHPDFGTKVSYHEKLRSKSNKPIWEKYDNYCILNSVGRGQEFVIEGNTKIIEWTRNLFDRV